MSKDGISEAVDFPEEQKHAEDCECDDCMEANDRDNDDEDEEETEDEED